jgi:Uma2 family endonuclease
MVSMLCPDAAYVLSATMKGISREDLKHLPHLVPDFVIELVSISDRRAKTEAKMQAWIANGVKLAWMIDPYSKQ